MLHDPARHEALAPIAWDESRVRATIARIAGESVRAFSPDTLWPVHPRDLEAGDDPAAPATCLYYGAAGVAWALDYLDGIGAAPAPAFAPDLDALRERHLGSNGNAASRRRSPTPRSARTDVRRGPSRPTSRPARRRSG